MNNLAGSFRDDVCAVVVTYFPDEEFSENLAALALQVTEILIVDNGSDTKSLASIDAAAKHCDAKVLYLENNFGLATALNIGLRHACEHGYKWLATFDQDSRVTPGMLDELFLTLNSFPHAEQVGIVSAMPLLRISEQRLSDLACIPLPRLTSQWKVVTVTVTSGNILNVQAASEVGGFEESFFIDYVDIELCLRLRRRGFTILMSMQAVLLHSIGRAERRCFNQVIISNHGALRRYYITRNRFIVWRNYLIDEFRFVVRDMYHFIRETLFISIYEEQAIKKIKMIMLGLYHGFRNIRGPLVAEHLQIQK